MGTINRWVGRWGWQMFYWIVTPCGPVGINVLKMDTDFFSETLTSTTSLHGVITLKPKTDASLAYRHYQRLDTSLVQKATDLYVSLLFAEITGAPKLKPKCSSRSNQVSANHLQTPTARESLLKSDSKSTFQRVPARSNWILHFRSARKVTLCFAVRTFRGFRLLQEGMKTYIW